ncbi:MAG: DUF1080 domain-containing protein [Fimbriimonadaceae bacterium]|nr:DUF1080 domain-containing protein [Fimbriimonadaceae bacterium]
MRWLRWLPVLLAAVGWSAAQHDGPSAPTARTELFNGRDLSGWKPFLPDPQADVTATWQVVDGVIRCSGQPAGYLRTARAWRDYHLTVEWRWPGNPGNSGVLLHMSPPDKVWPRSIECQLMHRNAGDFWVIDGTDFAEHTNQDDRRVRKQQESNEVRPGEWNRYDIECRGDRITVRVNGLLQNTATACTVSGGLIGLQSEGAPIEFRNVVLTPLE